MKRIESVYFYESNNSLYEKIIGPKVRDVIHSFSDVSLDDVKNLNRLISCNYLVLERTEHKNSIFYKGIKGYINLYNLDNGRWDIFHFMPNPFLNKSLRNITPDAKGSIIDQTKVDEKLGIFKDKEGNYYLKPNYL